MTVDRTKESTPSTGSPEATLPWAQQAAKAQPRSTARLRRMVDSLPQWEPLPPGEILVQRHQDR